MTGAEPGRIVAETVGRHVVLRGAQDPERERAFLQRLPAPLGRRFVLLGRAASRDTEPDVLRAALRDAMRDAVAADPTLGEVWLGVPGLAHHRELLADLARDAGVDVLGPVGKLSFAAGSAVVVSDAGGEPGWWRSARGAPPRPDGWRFPPRPWEKSVPDVSAHPLTSTPTMAGIAVRAAGATPVGARDLAFHIVGGRRAARVVVADPPPTPGAVATVLSRFRGAPPTVVTLSAAAASPGWLDALCAAVGGPVLIAPCASLVAADGEVRDVVLDEAGSELFDPFPTVLQLDPDGTQEVVVAAPPPPGWRSAGQTGYLPGEGDDSGIRVHVVPSGLVVGRAPAPASDRTRRFDPTGWTLELGGPDDPVDDAVRATAQLLVSGLDPGRRTTMRVVEHGADPDADPDPDAVPGSDADRTAPRAPDASGPVVRRRGIPEGRSARAARLGLRRSRPDGSGTTLPGRRAPAGPPDAVPPDGPTDAGTARPRAHAPVAGEDTPVPDGNTPVPDRGTPGPVARRDRASAPAAGGRAGDEPGRPDGRPTRPGPRITPAARQRPDGVPGPGSSHEAAGERSRAQGGPAEPPASGSADIGAAVPVVPRQPPAVPPSPAPVTTGTAGPAPVSENVPAVADPTSPVDAPDEQPVVPEPPGAPDEDPVPETALQVPDRPSTTAERRRFVAAAGDEFTEALAAVNTAMAAWPALRGGAGNDADNEAKADLAAVYLYLDGGEGTRAAEVDGAIRRGREGRVGGQLPCLVSGLRRLPVHRRPVLRQSVDDVGADQGVTGRLLGEAAFLSASTELDVTVPDARYDVLIMPATARRTGELTGGATVAEAVFPAGSRYRTLGLHEAEPTAEENGIPRVALLLRELGPDETASTARELDARDQAALSRLERALAGRRRATARVVDDPVVVARLTRRLAVVSPEAVAAGRSAGAPVPAGSGARSGAGS
ncbi:hypothetical protein [Pseudonocardia sp. ICBG1293]|uniref:hypothetical protein n=1 Tax=Pseudonocardia sp. ICBG1293 TaxID=2844382 RepID=UPI001CCAB503|nr:hypothetical protein [Pseudonocardia sp. ICBG1293]